jgi:phage-related protein
MLEHRIRIMVEMAYRVLYVAKFAEAVYVLHGFEKKTQKTPKADIDLANERYPASTIPTIRTIIWRSAGWL